MLVEAFIFYLIIGIFAGLMSGLLGVGGGLLVIPGFVLIFAHYGLVPDHLVMRMAAGTSLAAMIATSFFSLRAHYHHGINFWLMFRRIIPAIILGTISGVSLASILHSEVLRILFGLFVLGVALHLFIPEKPHPNRDLPNFWINSGVAFGIGAISGILGIGGSTLFIPYLIYYNTPMRSAIAVSTAGGFVIALTGTCAFIIAGGSVPDLPAWSSGYVYWPAALGVALMSPWAASLGAVLSHRLPVPILRRIFAVFLLFVALDMLI